MLNKRYSSQPNFKMLRNRIQNNNANFGQQITFHIHDTEIYLDDIYLIFNVPAFQTVLESVSESGAMDFIERVEFLLNGKDPITNYNFDALALTNYQLTSDSMKGVYLDRADMAETLLNRQAHGLLNMTYYLKLYVLNKTWSAHGHSRIRENMLILRENDYLTIRITLKDATKFTENPAVPPVYPVLSELSLSYRYMQLEPEETKKKEMALIKYSQKFTDISNLSGPIFMASGSTDYSVNIKAIRGDVFALFFYIISVANYDTNLARLTLSTAEITKMELYEGGNPIFTHNSLNPNPFHEYENCLEFDRSPPNVYYFDFTKSFQDSFEHVSGYYNFDPKLDYFIKITFSANLAANSYLIPTVMSHGFLDYDGPNFMIRK